MKTNIEILHDIYPMKAKLSEIYVEFTNDYLTTKKWAEHKGIEEGQAKELLALLKRIHETNVLY